MTMKCYRIWFDDDTATLLDGESEQNIRQQIEQGIKEGKYHGKIDNIECLDD